MKTVDEEILELLADDQPRSCLDIEEDILRDQNKIRPALQRLVNAGQIIRVKQPKAMIYMSIAIGEEDGKAAGVDRVLSDWQPNVLQARGHQSPHARGARKDDP